MAAICCRDSKPDAQLSLANQALHACMNVCVSVCMQLREHVSSHCCIEKKRDRKACDAHCCVSSVCCCFTLSAFAPIQQCYRKTTLLISCPQVWFSWPNLPLPLAWLSLSLYIFCNSCPSPRLSSI